VVQCASRIKEKLAKSTSFVSLIFEKPPCNTPQFCLDAWSNRQLLMKMVIMPLDSTSRWMDFIALISLRWIGAMDERSVVCYFWTKAVGRSLETNTIAHFWQSSPLSRSNGGKPFTPKANMKKYMASVYFLYVEFIITTKLYCLEMIQHLFLPNSFSVKSWTQLCAQQESAREFFMQSIRFIGRGS